MARLIDAKPILMRWNTESLGRKEMYDMVKNAPMVDAVPVIRCRDCRWWHDNGTLPFKSSVTGFCERLGTLEWFSTDYNDYCSFAERIDDELQEDDGRCELSCAE